MPKSTTQSSPPSTGKLARGAIAGMAVARAGLVHLGHKAQSFTASDANTTRARTAHEAKLGRIVFTALNQLKGTALKASQLLSMEFGLLPEGARQELARAHYQVTPLNRALVIKVLRQELGQDLQVIFAHFDQHAFAAASLGQVHAATLVNGEPVVVKLQYPGIAQSIASDMRMLGGVLQALCAHSDALPSADILHQVMQDIEHKLAEELDYLHEAQAMQWFGKHLALPGLRIAQPVLEHSTGRALTMEHLQGLHLTEWLATQPPQAERDYFGQLLWDTFLHCAFKLRRIQADPHPGNFLFMPNRQLGMLDFGCTRELGEGFCEALKAAWSALLRSPIDTAQMQQAYLCLGLIDTKLCSADFCNQLLPALAQMQAWQRLPFTSAVYNFAVHPPYPASHSKHHRQALQHLKGVPPDLPYFDRAYLGLTQMLKTLGARVRTTNPWIY